MTKYIRKHLELGVSDMVGTTCWLRLFLVTAAYCVNCYRALNTVTLVLGGSAWITSGGMDRTVIPHLAVHLRNRGSRGHPSTLPVHLVILLYLYTSLMLLLVSRFGNYHRRLPFYSTTSHQTALLRIFLFLLTALTLQHLFLETDTHWTVASFIIILSSPSFSLLPELAS